MSPFAIAVLLLVATQQADPAPMATPPGWLAETSRAEALIAQGQPLEAAAVYDKYSATQPWFPAAHYLRVGALIDAGRSDLVADALERARRAIPHTAPLRREAAMFVLDLVATREMLPREEAQRLVTEARALVDEALTVDPSFAEGLTTKASVLLLEAERLAQDPAGRAALQAEADALYQKAFAPPRP